ncbi:hypothetical protein QYE76_020423 [Lolium multiflorum]|uniref:Uncharacterized protein n=1 Tax=Lolium multiflorum TaxID=4521 RepID=A0AAD8R6D2_LOLMU|nr:hypothetical protein QYE76_020423 [Lolium multiflorum]
MGRNGQNRGPARGPIPKTDGRGVRDDPNPAQIWDEFAWPRKAGRSRPPLARLSVSQNTIPSHTSPAAPPPPTDRRFGSGVDAGHRRRDAGKRGGSIGRGPALLSPRRSRVEGRRRLRCCPLTVARPPAVRSCAVSAGGELSCPCFQTASRLRRPWPAGPYGSIWIASACEVFVEMVELKFVPFQIMVDSDDEYFFKNFIDTSSDEESDDEFFTEAALLIHEHIVSQIPVYRGSLPGHAAALDRKRECGHDQLYNDYFQPKPLFTPAMFRRRFRMSRPLFRRIMDGVKIYDDYFCAKVDAIGKVGLSSYQKCTAAIRMLAYGVAGDFVDEYTRMSESTGLEAMYRFCRAVIGSFGEQYLRQPNAEDTTRLLSINASRGFPGMLGSIDCMHWEWKNCPFGWQGAYSGHSEGCTVILEAVASHDTWIWHSFFGMAGSHNDINVLQRSPVFDRLAYGQSPDVDFEINGHHYTKGYYLADGIYPPWATLVKTIRKPNSEQEARFAKEQEAARKDVERAFGILQARWAIVRHPARAWDVQTLWEVMTACVIMHNMIVEVERDDSLFDNEWEGQGELVTPQGGSASFQDILHAHH